MTASRHFAAGAFLAYVVFATVVAGAAAPGAGMAVLVAGIFAAVIVDHARWHGDERGRTTLTAPFRPDPYGLRRDEPAAAAPPAPPPPASPAAEPPSPAPV